MAASDDHLGLAGKTVVVLGVADESSIAWGIARAFAAHGARVTIGYQQRFFSRVRMLLKDCPEIAASRCDVLHDEELGSFFAPFRSTGIDVLVHSIAYAPPEVFTRDPSEVGMAALDQTIAVSAISLLRVIRFSKPALRPWSSVVAMSAEAARRALPFYGMMGVAKSVLESVIRYLAIELGRDRIRVNAISPSPVETLAAYGEIMAFAAEPGSLEKPVGSVIREAFSRASAQMAGTADPQGLQWLHAVAENIRQDIAVRSPIHEPVSKEDVAGCALFLGSRLSTKITGQVIHVDAGGSSVLL